jgi:lipoprotein-anchoring transpeptidase ErfK/SrfK
MRDTLDLYAPPGAGTRQVTHNLPEGESIMRRSFLLAALLSLALAIPSLAHAGVVAQISLTSQRMQVYVNGKPTYTWKVSTARSGYRTPTGTYKPTALSRYHRSSIYDGSPMPHSIFFYKGYAIHGSYETKYLGRPASHGCVRLHPSNAAALYSLVQKYGPGNTTIKITQ